MPKVSYTKNELALLQRVTQPSGQTIEQLAERMVEYERVQVRAAEVFAKDPTKLHTMQKITMTLRLAQTTFLCWTLQEAPFICLAKRDP